MTGEILNINNEYRTYKDYKAAVDEELKKTAEGFVRIGYLLKVARDTDILRESGYNNVNDFAMGEYGLDKSQVSRFVRINDEFSEGGYSDRLQEKYRRYGYAKLAIMLMIPAHINEELSPSLSKTEILAVKEEVDEEQKITDLEVWMEEKDEGQQEYEPFEKVLHQLCHDKPDLYIKLFDAVKFCEDEKKTVTRLMDILAPAGIALHSVRIAGEGKKLLSIKGEDMELVVIDIRSGGKETCSWHDFIFAIQGLCKAEEGKESWERLYEGRFPGEEKKEKIQETPKKQTKVHKAKVKEPEEHEKTAKSKTERGSELDHRTEKEADGSSPEEKMEAAGLPDCPVVRTEKKTERITNLETEQIPGQMHIEKFQEYLPENCQVAPVQPEEEIPAKEAFCLGELKENLDTVYVMADKRQYQEAEEYLDKAVTVINRLMRLTGQGGENGKKTT